jgi:hypothetical protein
MSDLELTEHESDRLRELLHRRAGHIQVTTPQFDVMSPTHETPRRGNGRWLAAAAVVLLLAAVGGAWWLSSEGTDRIDSVPAEPTVTVAPQVLEQSGIWRLPEGLDGYQVVGAQDGGSYDSSSAEQPGVVAVDDPHEPTRWLLVQAYDEVGELEQLPEGTRQVALSDEVTMTLVPTSGSTWFRLTPSGDAVGVPRISGSALGIDDGELTRLLSARFSTVAALAAASDSSETMEAMVDDAGLGDDRLVWQGRGDGSPSSRNQQVQVSLAGDDGSEVTIIMNQADGPAWSVAVQLRMNAELLSLRSAGTAQGPISVRPRPELGGHVLESVAAVPGQPSSSTLAVLSDDGAWISAFPTFTSATGLEPATSRTLTEDEQLRIINSLRAMSEDEFLTRLSELGADFIGADPMMTTTTMQGGPNSPGG